MSHLQRWFLEQPGPAIALFAIAGLIALLGGLRRGQRGWTFAGAGLILLAAGIGVLGWLVVTPREQLEDRTRQVVAAADSPLDVPRFSAFFGPQATVRFGSISEPAPQAIKYLQELLSALTSHTHELLEMEVRDLLPDQATVMVLVRTTLFRDSAQEPHLSRWQLTWRRQSASGWRLESADCLEIDRQSPAAALGR